MELNRLKFKISKKKSSTGNGMGFGTKAFASPTELESAHECLITGVKSQAFDAAGLLQSF
jgi:hypothetical protein